jgi:hypothetical protein
MGKFLSFSTRKNGIEDLNKVQNDVKKFIALHILQTKHRVESLLVRPHGLSLRINSAADMQKAFYNMSHVKGKLREP